MAPGVDATPLGENDVAAVFDRLLGDAGSVLLAVSGGVDSTALLHLVHRWAASRGERAPALHVAIVDHGLRAEAAGEARWVSELVGRLGLPHATLDWEGAKPRTGIQAAARAARYRLLSAHARRLTPGPSVIAVAHTLDDQAETLLMRLARGSGLDGLSAMADRRSADGSDEVTIVRPLLAVPKARLVATLLAAGWSWVEDPSNEVDSYERVRLRHSAPVFAAAGLTAHKLALSARRLRRARAALDRMTLHLEGEAVDYHDGAYARIDLAALLNAPDEIALRLISRVLSRMGGQAHPPRLSKMEELAARLSDGGGKQWSSAGCLVCRGDAGIEVYRETGRRGLPEIVLAPGESSIWDRRFKVAAHVDCGGTLTVRALTPLFLANLRRTLAKPLVMPHKAALTVPSAWRGDTLVSAPLLGADPATRSREVLAAKFLERPGFEFEGDANKGRDIAAI